MHIVQRLLLLPVLLLAVGCGSHGAFTLAGGFRVMQEANGIVAFQRGQIDGDSHESYYDALLEFAESRNIKVVIVDGLVNEKDAPIYGRFWKGKPALIELRSGLSPNALVNTFAHELGHYFQPTEIDEDFSKNQVFAEAVGEGYCARIGLVSWRSAYYYLSWWPDPAQTILQYQTQIDAAVETLLEASR
jgi:hypothetical protein